MCLNKPTKTPTYSLKLDVTEYFHGRYCECISQVHSIYTHKHTHIYIYIYIYIYNIYIIYMYYSQLVTKSFIIHGITKTKLNFDNYIAII